MNEDSGNTVSRVIEENEQARKEIMFFSRRDITDSSLVRIDMQKTVQRGQEFTAKARISLDKLKEHYYYNEHMQISFEFCYVLLRGDCPNLVILPAKFDLAPFLDDEHDLLEYSVTMNVPCDYPLTIKIKDTFSCTYYAYLHFKLGHRHFFKKKEFLVDRVTPPNLNYSGCLLNAVFQCQRCLCIDRLELSISIKKQKSELRVAREETLRFQTHARPAHPRLEGETKVTLAMYFTQGDTQEQIKRILASHQLKFRAG